MDFNIKKYDNVRFHKDELTHKRIKVLLLWFEHEVYKNKLSLDGQVMLMDTWLDRLLKEEYYEVLPFFKALRADMGVKLNDPTYDTISETLVGKDNTPVKLTQKRGELVPKIEVESFLTRLKRKLIEWYRLIFKRG